MGLLLSIVVQILVPSAYAILGDYVEGKGLPIGGNTKSPMVFIEGLSKILVEGIVSVTAAVIVVGGIIVAASHGKDSWVENGKKIIIGGIIGFLIVMGSYGLYRMVVSFIYCGDYDSAGCENIMN